MPLNFTDPNANNQSYPQNVQLNRFGAVIGAKVTVFQMGYPSSSDTLRDDLGALLSFDTSTSQNKFSDVKLVILPGPKESGSTTVEFPAHKVILAARSPVFAKMFEHDMQESANNKVKVDDIQPDVFKVVLTYMYTGQVPKFSTGENNVVYELLYAADKYQLDDLKLFCERQLVSILNFQNAARIIQFAHLHNAPELKKATLQFISKNVMNVRATKEWEQVKQCPEIVDEIIQAMHTVIQSKN
jgi:speckle-type POZ protein